MRDSPTLRQLADGLATGRTTSVALVEACLARIAGSSSSSAIFVHVDAQAARAAAAAIDGLRNARAAPSPLAGIPITIKDLFDVQGQVTRAGSKVLSGAPAATDAPAVARLRRAGMVIVGRTNMTEFAFSGLGLNPHHGTPLSPWHRHEQRIAGGSTSGGATAVAESMAHASLGTDTGGSCRIPAAFCGLTGFKPTAARVSLEGAVPLSQSLDSVGTIARSVGCCATLDAILTDGAAMTEAVSVAAMRIIVPTNYVFDEVDDVVARAFEAATGKLKAAGARVVHAAIPALDGIAAINAKGGFAAAEAWAWHRAMIADRAADYDPRVVSRIRRGAQQDAADYLDLLAARRTFIADMGRAMSGFDAMLMPTTPILPPRLAELVDDEAYTRTNLLALRNPSVINLMDGCAISLPIAANDDAPVGIMLAGMAGDDRHVLAVAAGVEALLAGKDGNAER